MKITYSINKRLIFGDFHDYTVVVTTTSEDGRTAASGTIGPFSCKDQAEIFIASSGGDLTETN